MTLKQARPVGFQGLNLGSVPEVVDLTIADGIRYTQDGAASTRFGRVRAGLSWPDEGLFTPWEPYVQTIPHMVAPGRVRGVAPFYDQRVFVFADLASVSYAAIPQRLNFVYKANGTTYFNLDRCLYYNDPGASTSILSGDGTYLDNDTRAKVVVQGDRVYIVDESSRPKVLQARPKAEQQFLGRVRYEIRQMGIDWPRTESTTYKPAATLSAGGQPLVHGLYRFRIALENKFGVVSNPSLPSSYILVTDDTPNLVVIDWSAMTSQFPSGGDTPSRLRIYVQYLAEQAFNAISQIEPSAYVLLKSVDITGGSPPTSQTFDRSSFGSLAQKPLMNLSRGAPPKLKDMVIVDGVAYGLSVPDVIYRESVVQDGEQRYAGEIPGQSYSDAVAPRGPYKLYDDTIYKRVHVDGSHLFWSTPGEPENMENYLRIGNEQGVGLAVLGQRCVVFTDVGIHTFSLSPSPEFKRVFSRVGCMSRDSIVETETGILFMGSDGVPRLFNGATVEEVATELLPVFDQEDYAGWYPRFNSNYAPEAQAAYGKRKVFITLPVGGVYGRGVPSKPQSDAPSGRILAIADTAFGRPRWSLDYHGYDHLHWLGREARMLGITNDGAFYFIEEGDAQEAQAGSETPIQFTVATRQLSSSDGQQGDFYRLALDIDAPDATDVYAQVDSDGWKTFVFTVQTVGREQVKQKLPGTFRGRYMDVRLQGTSATGRFHLYGVDVETAPREVL